MRNTQMKTADDNVEAEDTDVTEADDAAEVEAADTESTESSGESETETEMVDRELVIQSWRSIFRWWKICLQ